MDDGGDMVTQGPRVTEVPSFQIVTPQDTSTLEDPKGLFLVD